MSLVKTSFAALAMLALTACASGLDDTDTPPATDTPPPAAGDGFENPGY